MTTIVDIQRIRIRLPALTLRVLLYIVVLVGAVVFAIPFVWMVRTAIMPPWQIYLFPPQWIPERIELHNFAEPFKAWPFGRWYMNSALLVVLNATGTVLSGSLAGFTLARLRFPGRDFFFLVILATMMLPGQVRLIPTYLLFTRLHWVNTFMPLFVPAWFGPAFDIFLLRQFFMTIHRELDDAARIDGCGYFGLYWRIALPLSLPALGVVAIFNFTFNWNDFMGPLIYLGDVRKYTVALGLRLLQGQLYTDLQAVMSAAVLSLLPVLIVFFLAQRHFVQGIVITGVKG